MKGTFRRFVLVVGALSVAIAVVAISQAAGGTSKATVSLPTIPAFTGAQLDAYPNGDWITAFGNDQGNRYSQLNGINTSNVSTLHTVWHLNLAATGGNCTGSCSQSASGIEYQGVLYFPSDNDNVYAIDAATGAILWQYTANLVP